MQRFHWWNACGRTVGEKTGGQKWKIYEADALSLRKNGKRFLPVMGEFHFSRYEPEDWEEELLKIKAGGVTIVATYVLWIHHEEGQGEWDFSGCRNLRKFLELCRKTGLQVWLRIGPWAHGECRNGGFPDWVVNDTRWKVRTNDPAYLKLVETFYRRIGEQAKGMMSGTEDLSSAFSWKTNMATAAARRTGKKAWHICAY